MKLVITQPNFVPWLGYFAQIHHSSKICFLDNVQYNRREWQNRNRITSRTGKVSYITANIKKAKRNSLINTIELSENFYLEKLLNKVRENYNGSKFLKELISYLEEGFRNALKESNGNLSKLNVELIKYFCLLTDIKLNYSLASCFDHNSKNIKTPTENLIEICKIHKVDEYLSSIGAKEYMLPEIQKFNNSKIKVYWQIFNHSKYTEADRKKKFLSHLSIVDYLAHNSIDSLKGYLESCHSEIEGN